METRLDTVVAAARLRLAAVTAEGAGYLTLLVVEALGAVPRRVPLGAVLLKGEGAVELGETPAATELEVERDCRRLLCELVSLAPSTTPALHAACERPAVGRLQSLRTELRAALIPINHEAARRGLARLFREVQRVDPDRLHARAERPVEPVGSVDAAVDDEAALDIEIDVSDSLPPAAGGPDGEIELSLQRGQASSAPPLASGAELDDPVDLGAATGPPGRSSTGPVLASEGASPADPALWTPAVSLRRSDVSELLRGFLAETDSDERIRGELRRLAGLPMAVPPRSADEATLASR